MSSFFDHDRKVEQRVFSDLPLVLFTGFMLAELWAPGLSDSYAGWPLVISLFFVGMPHGAVDLAINTQLRGKRDANILKQLTAFQGYVVTLVASTILFLTHPPAALLVFVILSCLHFGLADARDLELRSRAPTPSSVILISALSRGTLVIALPFFFSTNASLDVFRDVVRIAGGTTGELQPATVTATAALACGCAALLHLVVTSFRLFHGEWTTAIFEVVETGVITCAFALLNPLFAMGLFVLAWHSWRHMRSVTAFLDERLGRRSCTRLLTAVLDVHRYALPLLIPTTVVYIFIAAWCLDTWTSTSLAAVTIAVFVVVTLPHHFLVERLVSRTAPHLQF
jgi:Brp/Blh family beta-carotene 15,15'-monooxygenase